MTQTIVKNNSSIILQGRHNQNQQIHITGNMNEISIGDSHAVIQIIGNGNHIHIIHSKVRLTIFGNGNICNSIESKLKVKITGNANAFKQEFQIQPIQIYHCQGYGNQFPQNKVEKYENNNPQINSSRGNLLFSNNSNNTNQIMGPNLFQNPIQKRNNYGVNYDLFDAQPQCNIFQKITGQNSIQGNNYGGNNDFLNYQSQQNVFQKGMKVQKQAMQQRKNQIQQMRRNNQQLTKKIKNSTKQALKNNIFQNINKSINSTNVRNNKNQTSINSNSNNIFRPQQQQLNPRIDFQDQYNPPIYPGSNYFQARKRQIRVPNQRMQIQVPDKQPQLPDHGLTQSQMQRLHTHYHTGQQQQCTICFLQISQNDEQTYLNCFHGYHTYCIQTWLKKSSRCPVCNQNVRKNF